MRTATVGRTAASCCRSTALRPRSRSRTPGPGVAPGDADQILKRFRRGPDAGEDGGFGLGLAIGRELTQQAGGELTVEPSPHGARFRATFPLAEDDLRLGA
jgi:signal transduction histidine kinase